MLILRGFTAIPVTQPTEKECSNIVRQIQTHKHQINAVIWQDKGSCFRFAIGIAKFKSVSQSTSYRDYR